MAWSLYSGSRKTVIRCFENDEEYKVRLIVKSDGEYEEQITWSVEEDEVGERATSLLATYGIEDVRYGDKVPDHVVQLIESKDYVESVEEVNIDRDDNLFADFESMEKDEKVFLNEEYKEKIELPNMLSGTNRVAGLFVSAGFATAITSYSLFWAVTLGLLSGLVGLSGFVAIQQIRTEVTPQSAPELYESFQSAVENSRHVDEANMYVIKEIVGSPFTLPMKSDVYFPIDTVENMTEGEIKAIVEHELGHHKNSMISMFAIVASIASTLLVAPVLVIFTSLNPGVTLFLALVAYTGAIQLANLALGRRDEEVADKNVSRQDELVKSLVRLSPSVYHVNSTAQSIVHRVFDVHPPMNERIEKLYDNHVSLNTRKEHTWGVIAWIGACMTVIGSVFIGYGFLTFTSAGVSDIYIFYGTILTVFGIIPQYYVNKGKKKAILLVILLCLSFSFTVGLGFWMGADSIVGAVAQGRIGRQVIALCGTMVLTTVLLLSSVHFDWSPDKEDIPEPAVDWFKSIED